MTRKVETISRQAAIEAADKIIERDTSGNNDVVNAMIAWSEYIKQLPPAHPEYEPVTARDFAKTMSENTLYGFMVWYREVFTLIKEMGFEICKKTM